MVKLKAQRRQTEENNCHISNKEQGFLYVKNLFFLKTAFTECEILESLQKWFVYSLKTYYTFQLHVIGIIKTKLYQKVLKQKIDRRNTYAIADDDERLQVNHYG